MQSKIDNLVKMYKNNKGKYLFDNVENLEFDEKGNINISLAFANGKYYIFVFYTHISSLKQIFIYEFW